MYSDRPIRGKMKELDPKIALVLEVKINPKVYAELDIIGKLAFRLAIELMRFSLWLSGYKFGSFPREEK